MIPRFFHLGAPRIIYNHLYTTMRVKRRQILYSFNHNPVSTLLSTRFAQFRVIQFSMEELTGGINGAIKRFDPLERARAKALPHTVLHR
jgi:hypothetical protein